MKRLLFALLPVLALSSFGPRQSFKGVWQYSGGIYNDKAEAASNDYQLQRIYDDAHYQAVFVEPNEKPQIYEKGDYLLKQDTCLETQTYSSQPSKVTGITVHYHYQLRNDTLTFTGVLPNGTTVKEYWKKVK